MPAAPSRPSRPVGRSGGQGVVAATVALLLVLALASASSASSGPSSGTGLAATTGDAAATILEGIDVSHWQNTIDWTKVAAAGKKFAIIKATDGQVQTDGTLYVDPLYATNHARAKAAGLWTGAYHFARPDATANDAIREADHFAGRIGLGTGDLIPALDLEDAGGLPVTALQAWVKSFLDEVTARVGVRPMIYTSPSFWETYMGNSQALADAGYKTLWIAHWGVSSPRVPANNWGGRGWTFWQYTSDGSVPGIVGRVDLDRFNGADLATQAYSIFKLAASLPGGSIRQGTAAAATVSILRTNFSTPVGLTVTGLPAGSTATFAANPSSDATVTLNVTTPADPTATPQGTYPLTITGVGGDQTKTTQLNLVVVDGIAPTVGVPAVRLAAGRVLGTNTIPVQVVWSAVDPSGIVGTGLQRSINGGAWTGVGLPSMTAMAADVAIPFGSSLRPRVRAMDGRGNLSGWQQGRLARANVDQQWSSAVTWTGTWRIASSSVSSAGSVKYATGRGASATFRFTGSNVAWVAAKGPTRGSALVYVDGVYAGTVSLRAATNQSRSIAFARNFPSVGAHTLRIVVAGTAGHPRVDIDAFIRLSIS